MYIKLVYKLDEVNIV